MNDPTFSPPVPPAKFNALLGSGLVLANGLLFYLYFFSYEVSENDKTRLVPTLISFVAAQWLLLALASKGRWKTVFWVAFGLSGASAGLLWLGYFWLLAFASSFKN